MQFLKIEERSDWPSSQTLNAFIEEQLEINKQLEALPIPVAGSVDIDKVRQFRLYNADGSFKPKLLDTGCDQLLEASNVQLRLRKFEVEHAKGIYLHFHGGGWVMGSIHEQDDLLWRLAQSTDLTVISVEYPLAPEAELATIIDYVINATIAVMDDYPEQLFCIGGESAGSHLALCSVLGLVSIPEKLARVFALNLSYGIYDLSMTPSQRTWGDRMLGLSTSYLEWFYTLALPNKSLEERRGSSLSPLYQTSLVDLPPAVFTVGEYDPLLDDSLFMAARWKSAGNVTSLKVYPRAPHGFNGLPSQMANAANAEIAEFIRDNLINTVNEEGS